MIEMSEEEYQRVSDIYDKTTGISSYMRGVKMEEEKKEIIKDKAPTRDKVNDVIVYLGTHSRHALIKTQQTYEENVLARKDAKDLVIDAELQLISAKTKASLELKKEGFPMSGLKDLVQGRCIGELRDYRKAVALCEHLDNLIKVGEHKMNNLKKAFIVTHNVV